MEPPETGLPFEEVLRQELDRIRKSREFRLGNRPARPHGSRTPNRPRSIEEEAHREGLIGLAFSGGGIRSATFNLGILQGLAKWNMLAAVDYLSTVSGGGYIGSWFHAWVKRHPKGIHGVCDSLTAGQDDRRAMPPPADAAAGMSPTAEPVRFLRRYANYLTPRTGLLSTDTWTMISIWIRNTMLNQMILFLALAALLLVPRTLKKIVELASREQLSPLWAAGLMFLAVLIIGLNQSAFARKPTYFARIAAWFGIQIYGRRTLWFHQPGAIKMLVVVPVVIVAFLGSSWFEGFLEPSRRDVLGEGCLWVGIVLFVFLGLIAFVGGVRECFLKAEGKGGLSAFFWILVVNALASAAGAGALYAVASVLTKNRTTGYDYWHVLAWGTPGFLLLFSLVVMIHLGLLGREFPDDRREWWSRLGASITIFLLGWMALFSAAIYGPLLLLKLHAVLDDAWSIGALAGWAGTVAAGLWAASSSRTGDPDKRNGILSFAAKLAPPVFIGGIILLLAGVVHRATLIGLKPDDYPAGLRQLYCPDNVTCPFTPSSDTLVSLHFHLLSTFPESYAALWALGLFAASWLLAMRVDINEFSLHQFYRNRLVRCYLGASRDGFRKPNLFTGFDPDDGILLKSLDPAAGYTGPYPIINTALNLVHGENLAWQERKAESFVFTPAYCGYDVTNGRATHVQADRPGRLDEYAYRPTAQYSDTCGPGVGQSMAISGAAASPNSGYHSSPSAGFLMTVFDVRLGWWIGNPRHKHGWQLSSPRAGLFYLLYELMGLTNDRRRFVYLSDGGHFENLAIYELIRRRCRYIIACDAEQDPSFTFEGLGNAIRKCRTDLNVEIDLVVDRLQPSPETGLSGAHCVVGTIRYPEHDASGQQLLGTLVYIKASMTGDEPTDVLEYGKRDATFPHTSTADQWFNESQFESYRRLGLHVTNTVFRNVAEEFELAEDPEMFFRLLRQQWYPPSRAVQAKFTEHTRALSELTERLRGDPNLRFLHGQVSPEWPALMGHAGDPPRVQGWLPHTERELRAGFLFCNSVIQLMENVYIDLNLEEDWNHPDNRGWFNVFNHWVWSSMFRVTWAASAASYGARFQTFCQKRLQLGLGTVRVSMGAPDDLNDFERRKRYEPNKQEGDIIWNLELHIDNPAVGEQTVAFRFGFALVDKDGYLAFYRVQNHLRKMGLWSAVEPVLWETAGIKGLKLRERTRMMD